MCSSSTVLDEQGMKECGVVGSLMLLQLKKGAKGSRLLYTHKSNKVKKGMATSCIKFCFTVMLCCAELS